MSSRAQVLRFNKAERGRARMAYGWSALGGANSSSADTIAEPEPNLGNFLREGPTVKDL